MTDLQIILLCLTIVSALYQVFVFGNIVALTSRYGSLRMTWPLRFALLLTVAIEIVFVLAMTGRIS